MPDLYSLEIGAVTVEANDTLCVTFKVPAELTEVFSYMQGQYLTLCAIIDGVEVRRSYSICAGVGEPLQVAIKRIDGGVFSQYAHEHFAPQQVLQVLPPAGQFHSSLDGSQQKAYLCIAAGSGITPVLSNIKTVLASEPMSRVTLLYGNQRSSSIIFKEALCWLKNAYMERFQWINIFTRETQDAAILNGRIDNKKGGELNRHLIEIKGFDEFFLCGPEAMISEVSRGLRSEGVAEANIHYELFLASAEDARTIVAKHQARAREHQGLQTQVRARFRGREVSFELAADGENLLDAAIAQGLDLPFSCKGGVCATCKARVLEGEVEMDLNHALTADEVAAGFVLSCQSHPVSDRMQIDFD